MNENIDLIKILKNCPKGTKLYSKVHGEVEFACISDKAKKPIVVIANQKDNEIYYKTFTAKGCIYSAYETDECLLVPSKEQQDWSKFTAPWYNKTDKFDPKTLRPFDKVLVIYGEFKWKCRLFSHIDNNEDRYKYDCCDALYEYCIPYNDDTKHLVGTRDEAPEYYRYWEK